MKSYNPFRLWGTYVGLFLGILVLAYSIWLKAQIIGGFPISMAQFLSFYEGNEIVLLFFPILGFMAGYGIHYVICLIKK